MEKWHQLLQLGGYAMFACSRHQLDTSLHSERAEFQISVQVSGWANDFVVSQFCVVALGIVLGWQCCQVINFLCRKASQKYKLSIH